MGAGVSHNVFANTWQIAAESGNNKSIARFPDVCLSPPSPPAGPLPIPYPDTSFSSDLKEGSETVTIGGKPAALAQKSYYKPSTLGNEAATRSFGASVITHQITGKTYFQAWSMDVKIEGKNVCRHIDITTSNHASYPGGTPPLPTAEQQTALARLADPDPKCPCCGKPGTQCPAALPTTVTAADGTKKPREALAFHEFYRLDDAQPGGAPTRRQQMAAKPCAGGDCPNAGKPERKSDAPCDVYRVTTTDESGKIDNAYSSRAQKTLRTHHKIPKAKGAFKALPGPASVEPLTKISKATWDAMGGADPEEKVRQQNKVLQLDHTTPRAAGGCPTSENNTQPHFRKCANCKEVDGMLDTWNGQELETRRAALGVV
jgi:uncharacterized Zn-binding protein involved in type VI secretion